MDFQDDLIGPSIILGGGSWEVDILLNCYDSMPCFIKGNLDVNYKYKH
jgi:hypothetical protein